MDNAKQSRSVFRRVGDFFYNWANGSEWSQLDAIMLAVGLWLFGCLIIGGFFAANWIQSITPASKKHEMYAQGQMPNSHGQSPNVHGQPPQAHPTMQAPMPIQYTPSQPYGQAQAQAPMHHPLYSDGRSARLYSNRSHGGAETPVFGAQMPVHPQADATQGASSYISEPYVPRFQKYEVLSNFPKYSDTELAQKFGAPRTNTEFPMNWQPFGQNTSGEANAFAVP